MIACEKCDAPMSEQAAACPHCGHPRTRSPVVFRRLFLVSLILLGAAATFTALRSVQTANQSTALDRASSTAQRIDQEHEQRGEHESGEQSVAESEKLIAMYEYIDLSAQRVYGVYAVLAITPLTLIFFLLRRREEREAKAIAIGRSVASASKP